MTNAAFIWIWGLVFFFAAIPGTVLGWIVGALFGSTSGVTLSFVVAIIGGFVAAEKTLPGTTSAVSSGAVYALFYPMMFIPPFLVAMLLGVWISNLTSRAQ